MLAISADQQSFVHVIKFKKRQPVTRSARGEVIRTFYRGEYHAFDDDFSYFDYEIAIGQLDLGTK